MSRIAPKPQLTVQNNGHISSSWSSPERNAALVSSPDHLQPYYSPLTENSDSTEAVSPALYEDDLAPSQHFLSPTKVSFSPVVSSFGNQFSPKSSIRANPIPQSPGFSMDNSATSMSSTPVMLKSVTTASKQDRLELFMKFQPAGYQIQGPIPLQQFAQGWYPGAQTWVTFSYKDLTYPGPYPKDVDVRKRECYLSNDEFQRTFMMNRQVFYELPAWKQILLRKSCKLF